MDAITGFVYGMSMMFFSMMAWMFWRKGSDRLFRLIMILMLHRRCTVPEGYSILLFHRLRQ